MGFFDKAKEKIKNFSNDVKDDQKPLQNDQHDFDDPISTLLSDNKPKQEQQKLVKSNESAFDIDSDYDDSDDFINAKIDDEYEDSLNKNNETIIKDVLDTLNISATFEISPTVFLPDDDDLRNPNFDYQVPKGYEISEVDAFVKKTQKSIEEFVKLLRKRNEDIAKLATTADRLQVDSHNAKLQAELANGINVMPTTSDAEIESLESENFKLNQKIKILQQKLAKKPDNNINKNQPNQDLQDELSITVRENEDLKDKIYDLKNELAIALENNDNLENNNLLDFGLEEQNLDEIDLTEHINIELENDENDLMSLPDLSEFSLDEKDSNSSFNTNKNSAFYDNDEKN